MKLLFATAAALLIVGALGLKASFPEAVSDRPVLYWITDKNPARHAQVATFHRWLVEQGHTAPDGGPVCELRLDFANNEITKKIIQGVSGVGSELMDVGEGRFVHLYQQMGILRPVDEEAAALGFGVDRTFPGLAPELTVNGVQYAYPCNVGSSGIFVNPAAFDAAGVPQPPDDWTFAEFEALGRRFVAAANPPGTRPGDRRFFLNALEPYILHRALGVSQLNATGTASELDSPAYVESLRLLKRWTQELRLMPTPEDIDAQSSASGFGGPTLALFSQGRYAMITGGRWYLIQLRRYPGLVGRLRVIMQPHGGFPNTPLKPRAAAVYAGADRPDLAALFLAYLASPAYNALIIDDSDALPPNPAVLDSEAFLRPPGRPAEWHLHGPLARVALDHGVAGTLSPFIQANELEREVVHFREAYLAGLMTAEAAAARTAAAIDRRIAATLDRKPSLRAAYARRLRTQAAIDARRAAGAPVPANWIDNAFHAAYFRHLGILGPPEAMPEPRP